MKNKLVSLSPNGPQISPVVAGVMKWGVWGSDFSSSQLEKLIKGCLELGVSTFDHADIYGHYTTEAAFGAVLKQAPTLRHQMQIITKCGIKLTTPNRPQHQLKSYDTSHAHIVASAEQSLQNLGTDYLDLLLIHRPSPLMQADEIAEAFTELHRAGKVRYFGVSNFTPSQFSLLHERFPLTTNQIEASLLHLDPLFDGTLDQLQQHRVRPTAWSPLGGGAIFDANSDETTARIHKAAAPLLKRYGFSLDQLLLAWLLQHPAGIVPVLGTGKLTRIKKAVKAMEIQLTREEWFSLLEAARGEEVA